MKLEVLKNNFLKDRYFLLELSAASSLKTACPGQFFHIRIEDSYDPLLRRPFSIHDVGQGSKNQGPSFKILYEIVGKGTELLSQKKPGSNIDCLGPLGRGFDLKQIEKQRMVYIVAGGMGVAPLFFLARKIMELKTQNSKLKTIVLLGAEARNHILCEKEFKALGCEVQVATEDGSKGFRGRVTGLLKELLAAGCGLRAAGRKSEKLKTGNTKPEAVICACGPKPMLTTIAKLTYDSPVAAQVSLEEFMGCGLGACLGCVVRTTSGHKRVCHDGPVFDSREIIWEKS